MRKKIRKYLMILCSLWIVLGNILPVHASQGNVVKVECPVGVIADPNNKWAIGLTSATSTGYYSAFYSKLSINGKKVYCLEPLVSIVDGAGDYQASDLASYYGNAALTQKLERISGLGYGFQNDYSMEMDFATQIRIWQEISPGLITNVHPSIQAKIDLINQRLKVMYTDVSFKNQTVILNGFGEEFAKTLTDTNNVLSYYELESKSLQMQKNGNQLKVWMNPEDGVKGSLSMHCFYAQQGTSIAYRSPYGYQNVGYITGGTPNRFTISCNVQVGSIQINKEDFETDANAQGEAVLSGAQYEVIDNKTGQRVGVLTISDDLSSNVIGSLPTDRTYTLKEIKAPQGYKLNPDSVVVDFKNGLDKKITMEDEVITGSFSIRKVNTDGAHSEIVTPEPDAVFHVVLKKYADQYGSIEKAWEHKEEFSLREWDELTTDKNGNAASKALAYGTYVIKQVSGKEETDLLKETFTFVVDKENQSVVEYTINNRPSDYYLRLVKKDAKTKERIVYSSASFQIYDKEGKLVTMRVGNKVYDTFSTASEKEDYLEGSFCVKDETGSVITPLKLKAGTYTIKEVKSPQGYLLSDKEIKVTIESTHVIQEDIPLVEVEILDEKPVGKIILHKEFEKEDSLEVCPQKVLFQLRAKEDIMDPKDGKILYKAGETVDTGGHENGIYSLNENNELIIENLPLSVDKTVYTLEEIQTKEGYQLLEDKIDIEFEIKDDQTKEYVVSKTVENKKIRLTSLATNKSDGSKVIDSRQKTILSDQVRVSGLQKGKVYRLIGEIIDKKTGKPAEVDGESLKHELNFVAGEETMENLFFLEEKMLEPGEYVIYETLLCEDGHVLARHQDIEDDKQTFTVIKTKDLAVKKVDSKTNKSIKNSEFEFTLFKDAQCKEIFEVGETDLSNGVAKWKHLKEGTYYLKETKAPEGYVLPNSVYKVEIKSREVLIDGKKWGSENDVIEIVIKNTKVPKVHTGISGRNSAFYLWLSVFASVSIAIVLIQWIRIHKKQF